MDLHAIQHVRGDIDPLDPIRSALLTLSEPERRFKRMALYARPSASKLRWIRSTSMANESSIEKFGMLRENRREDSMSGSIGCRFVSEVQLRCFGGRHLMDKRRLLRSSWRLFTSLRESSAGEVARSASGP